MKTHFLRVPVSRWNDDAAVDLKTVKLGNQTEDYYLVPDGQNLKPANRLVVIVPPADFSERDFALKIARLAQWGRKAVLLIATARDPLDDSLMRRRMVTIASYLRSPNGSINYLLLEHEDWIRALRELLSPEDRLICVEDHFITGRWLRNVSLAQHLAAALFTPVGVMRGMRLELEPERRWAGLRELLIWGGILLTMALFLAFQIQIQQVSAGALGTLMEVISIVIEVLVIVRISTMG